MPQLRHPLFVVLSSLSLNKIWRHSESFDFRSINYTRILYAVIALKIAVNSIEIIRFTVDYWPITMACIVVVALAKPLFIIKILFMIRVRQPIIPIKPIKPCSEVICDPSIFK